jgi:hypothetical protein
MLRTHPPALALAALLGAATAAAAQAPCPELTRLRGAAQAVLKETGTGPAPARCHHYIRLSQAWGALAQFAGDHRAACQVSSPALDAFARYQRQAEADRDHACAGRPLRAYGADVIQH